MQRESNAPARVVSTAGADYLKPYAAIIGFVSHDTEPRAARQSIYGGR